MCTDPIPRSEGGGAKAWSLPRNFTTKRKIVEVILPPNGKKKKLWNCGRAPPPLPGGGGALPGFALPGGSLFQGGALPGGSSGGGALSGSPGGDVGAPHIAHPGDAPAPGALLKKNKSFKFSSTGGNDLLFTNSFSNVNKNYKLQYFTLTDRLVNSRRLG